MEAANYATAQMAKTSTGNISNVKTMCSEMSQNGSPNAASPQWTQQKKHSELNSWKF